MTTAENLVVVGGSAGGVEAMQRLVSKLPAQFEPAVLAVLHLSPDGPSMLPQILSRAGKLPATHPSDGEPIRGGHVYVAPPGLHMSVQRNHIRLATGPRVNRFRPSIDVLFESAASSYDAHLTGVVLTGTLDDGVLGMQAIKSMGGITIVQDPAEALFPVLPQSVLDVVAVDHCFELNQIAHFLIESAGRRRPMDRVAKANPGNGNAVQADPANTPTDIACPDCHGVLNLGAGGDVPWFRCRVGHQYTLSSLMDAHSESLERALWAAVRTLEESADLCHKMSAQAQHRGHPISAAQWKQRAEQKSEQAELVRSALDKATEPESMTVNVNE